MENLYMKQYKCRDCICYAICRSGMIYNFEKYVEKFGISNGLLMAYVHVVDKTCDRLYSEVVESVRIKCPEKTITEIIANMFDLDYDKLKERYKDVPEFM